MYPNSSDTPSARGQELVPFKPEVEVLEGFIVEGPFRLNPGGPIPRPRCIKAATAFRRFGEAARDAGLVPEEPVEHHDAGECWTNPDDTESVENTCGCRWYEPIEHPKQETPECT